MSGALLGAAGAYGVSRVLIALIPSLPTRDPLILAMTSLALVAVALVACYIPASRHESRSADCITPGEGLD